GVLHATGDRVRAQALAAMRAVRGEPVGTLDDDVAHPVQGFHVVLERRTPEQADLGDVRRAQARHAALAFDRLDHRRLFAADVGTRAATQVDLGHVRYRRLGFELLDLGRRSSDLAMVLVAQVNVDFLDADRPGRDQRALAESVRIALEVVAVLEGAGLALVDVDRHQARAVEALDDAPLAPGREARATETAQARVFHDLEHGLDIAQTAVALLHQLVAIALLVGLEVDVLLRVMPDFLFLDQRGDLVDGGVGHRILVHDGHRRLLAAPHTGRVDDAHVLAEDGRQLVEQILRTGHLARQPVAHADGQ